MQKGEKTAGIIIFIMTIPYGLYALSQLAVMLKVIINPIHNNRTVLINYFWSFGLWVFMGYFSVFLIGIFALPLFQKFRFLLIIPLGIIALSLTWLYAPTIISLFSKSGLHTRLDTVQIINTMRSPITSMSSVLLCACILLYFMIKKIRAFLPAIALFISFVVRFAYSVVYFTSWYWSLFPEDVIKEVGLTLMFSYFLIFETIHFHLIFLLLLIFIKPYYKNKEKPQLIPSETEATG